MGPSCSFLAGLCCILVAFELFVTFLDSQGSASEQQRSALQRYFEYGRSIEGKLDAVVGAPSQQPGSLVRAGWLPDVASAPADGWKTADRRIVIYGMSFTDRIANHLDQLDDGLAIVTRSAPAAPLNYLYAVAESDPWHDEADVVVIGILSSSIPYLKSTTGLGWTPENPAPYTFPIFSMREDRLVRNDPVIDSMDVFVDAFRKQDERWQQHRDQISKMDAYWDPFVFRRSMLDDSALLRLVRRAWAKLNIDSVEKSVYDPNRGFLTTESHLAAVPVLLDRLKKQCDLHHQRCVVVLLHTQGDPGHLEAWLKEPLEAQGIGVVSSASLFSARDAMNFETDGHYLPSRDKLLAKTLLQQVR